MKSKKAKKTKPIVHTKFPFSELQRKTLSYALDFLMNCETFSFDEAKISRDCAFSAAEKVDCGDCILTRGEVRASAKAVELALSAIKEYPANYDYIDSDFPGILSFLKENDPVLQHLSQVLDAVVKDLRKMK